MTETVEKYKDGWLSKKWLFFILSFGAGISLAYFGVFNWPVGAFLLSLPVTYGYVNVKNKDVVLKHFMAAAGGGIEMSNEP